MSNDVTKRKLVELADEPGDKVKKTKVQEDLSVLKLEINPKLKDSQVLEEIRAKWGKSSFETTDIQVCDKPFAHVEVDNILVDPGILKSLKDILDYTEKSSDLFHFHQSVDLISVKSDFEGYSTVQQISNFFKTDLLDTLKAITGLPLSGKYDIFASEYKKTDHLLCHDDELDSRRIAFIIYMSEKWEQEYGGTLDLFDCIENDNGPFPGKIVKSIVPKFNKLVFFEVTAKSFHQVSEVLHESASRLAVSGWFYGDPLPRPEVNLPGEAFYSVDFPERKESKLEEFLGASYLDPETVKTANDQLSENSEILLASFLKAEVYASLLRKLEAISESEWEHCGPANLRNYHQLPETVPGFPSELKEFFTSKNFLEFLQELTEFPFASEPDLRFTYSLKKFKQGSYTLIKGKERTYRPKNFVPLDSTDENSDEEIPEEEYHSDPVGDENVSPLNDKPESSKAGNGVPESQEEDEDVIAESPEGYEIVEDEEPEEPNRVDIVFFLIPPISTNETNGVVPNGASGCEESEPKIGKWQESWGGNRIYTDDLTGNQLINLIPSDNALAVVVRDESISSHYSYVNSLAKDRLFYCYDFEFDFPRGK